MPYGYRNLERCWASQRTFGCGQIQGGAPAIDMGIWSGVGSQFDLSTCTSPSRPHVFDAFESLPGYGQASTYLENSEAAVRHNFDKYGLLDQRVKFYKGLSGGGLRLAAAGGGPAVICQ